MAGARETPYLAPIWRVLHADAAPAEPQAPEPDPALEERQIGAGIAYLLMNRSWVHRRTEYIRFVDADTVNRQMGVDFTLPIHRRTEQLYALRPGLVPLATLKKQRLTDFSLWDEEGRRLPMLNTEQAAYYSGAALVAMARGTAKSYEMAVPNELNAALRLIASQNVAEAPLIVKALRLGVHSLDEDEKAILDRNDHAAAALEPFRGRHPLARALLCGPGDPRRARGKALDEWNARHRASKTFASFADQLATQFVVFTQLTGNEEEFTCRRLLKFCYEQPLDAYRSGLGGRARSAGRRCVESLSWWPKMIILDGVAVGNAASYHVEIVAPDDIEIVGAEISAGDPGRPQDVPIVRDSTAIEQQRAHLQIRGAPRAALGPLWVELRAEARGFLNAAMFNAALIVVLLWLGQDQLKAITAEGQGSNLEAAATILVAVPGLVSAFLLRPGEHEMASRLLAGPRLLVIGSAACSLAAAGVLAGAYSQDVRETVWAIASIASLVLFLALGASYAMPRIVPWIRRKLQGLSNWWLKNGD